jgi:hypothetical protein
MTKFLRYVRFVVRVSLVIPVVIDIITRAVKAIRSAWEQTKNER